MIIVILVIALFLFAYFNIIPGKFHTAWAWLFMLISFASVGSIVAHDYSHMGMKEVTTVKTENLASAVPMPSKVQQAKQAQQMQQMIQANPAMAAQIQKQAASMKMPGGILIYQPLGNGTEKVYVYHTKQKDKLKPIKTDHMSAKTVTSKKAQVEIKTTKYVYQNNTVKLFFGIFGRDNELVKRQYIFHVPSDWRVISTKKAKDLQKQMTAMKKQQEQMMKKAQSAQAAQKNK